LRNVYEVKAGSLFKISRDFNISPEFTWTTSKNAVYTDYWSFGFLASYIIDEWKFAIDYQHTFDFDTALSPIKGGFTATDPVNLSGTTRSYGDSLLFTVSFEVN